MTDAFRLTSPLSIPLLLRYRQVADDCTDHLQHEQVSCPAIIVPIFTIAEESMFAGGKLQIGATYFDFSRRGMGKVEAHAVNACCNALLQGPRLFTRRSNGGHNLGEWQLHFATRDGRKGKSNAVVMVREPLLPLLLCVRATD